MTPHQALCEFINRQISSPIFEVTIVFTDDQFKAECKSALFDVTIDLNFDGDTVHSDSTHSDFCMVGAQMIEALRWEMGEIILKQVK